MKKKRTLLGFALLLSSGMVTAQMHADGHAYMIGDYVEIGINARGHIGTPPNDFDGAHTREGIMDMPGIGILANPNMDGWDEYNGDYVMAGSPECGFGFSYKILGYDYHKGNNVSGPGGGLYQIPGSITDYYESTDSIIVNWEGSIWSPPLESGMDIRIAYELQKDQHYFTTSVTIENIGVEDLTDIYYYRTLDSDNNVEIDDDGPLTFYTDNRIESQSEMSNDSVIVSARQTYPWESKILLHAHGDDWKGSVGGFGNRNGEEMWTGSAMINTTEGYMNSFDMAISLSHKTEILAPDETAEFSFVTAFKCGIDFSTENDDDQNREPELGVVDFKAHLDALTTENHTLSELTLYPNPTQNGLVTIQLEGAFNYQIEDLKGTMVQNGTGNGIAQINLTNAETGIYLVKINQGGAVAVRKLILQ